MGWFKINQFVAVQLMQGAIIFHNKDDKKLSTNISYDVIIMLADLGLNGQVKDQTIILHRTQVVFLRKLLDACMKHCEVERDDRIMIGLNKDIPKFNIDTYIAMKFLMLDIREWLLGEVVEENPTDYKNI